MLVIFLVVGWYFYAYTSRSIGPNDWVYCYPAGKDTTRVACDVYNAVAARTQEKQRVALPKGCVLTEYSNRPIYCNNKRDYDWNTDVWVETEDSKACVPFYDRKVSDMPLRCLDYFNLKP